MRRSLAAPTAARLTAFIVVGIVAATLIAGLIVGAQRDDNAGPVDLIVFNGKVYKGDGTGTFAEAVAIRGAQILRVGTNREIKRLRRAQTEVIDAHGGAVMAGFNDAHLHVRGDRLGLEHVDLSDADSLDDIQSRIDAFAAANPDRPWVVGRGWSPSLFPDGLPTREQLDAVISDRPAYMECSDGETGWVNSKALDAARISRRTLNPAGGQIAKDSRTGAPTGILKRAATALVTNMIPAPTRAERLRALRAAIEEAHRFGVTSIQTSHGSAGEFELFDEIRQAGELKVRVYAALSIPAGFTESNADRLDAIRQQYPEDPLFKTGAVSIAADTRPVPSASRLAASRNRPRAGVSNGTTELNRLVSMLDRRGWQILIDASGDGAVRLALDAFERAAAANPAFPRGRRHRIEHIRAIEAEDLRRFGKLGIIASIQPLPEDPDATSIDLRAASLGEQRAPTLWPWNSINASGGRLAFGSDWPVASMDPRLGIDAAFNGPATSADGAQPLSLPVALDAYTSGGAYASFDEHRKGSLAPGMLADIAIFSADLFALPPQRVLDAVVDVTIFDGKVVYTRPRTETN